MLRIALMFVALGLPGCGGPDLSAIKVDFESECVGCQVLDLGVGEGDAEWAYIHFRYKDAKGDLQKKVIQYRKTEGAWRRAQETPSPNR